MKLQDILTTASANMLRSKVRTMLTILAIFIGAFTLSLTNGIGAGVSGYMDKQVNTMGPKDVITIQRKDTQAAAKDSGDPEKYNPKNAGGANITSRFPIAAGARGGAITEADITELKTVKDLTDIQPVRAVSPDYVQGVNGEKYKLTTSPIGTRATLDLAAGQQVHDDSTENRIVLPINYVKPLGYSSADEAVGKTVEIGISDAFGKSHTVIATVVGVQQTGLVSSGGAALNQTLTANLYDLQTHGLPDVAKNKFGGVSARIVGSTDDKHIADIEASLDKLGYTARTPSDVLGVFNTVISAITAVLNGFAIIALLAASFGIVNTLLMSVQERTKEIGLMKAMGMRGGRIFLLFSTEATLIGFWGSALGVVVAVGIGNVINNVLSQSLLKDLPGLNLFDFTPIGLASIVLLIMVIAFLAGTLPARKAAGQNPIDALRYE